MVRGRFSAARLYLLLKFQFSQGTATAEPESTEEPRQFSRRHLAVVFFWPSNCADEWRLEYHWHTGGAYFL